MEELSIPLHSMQVANVPQLSLQLATMLHDFGSSRGSHMSLFGATRSAAFMIITMRATARIRIRMSQEEHMEVQRDCMDVAFMIDMLFQSTAALLSAEHRS